MTDHREALREAGQRERAHCERAIREMRTRGTHEDQVARLMSERAETFSEGYAVRSNELEQALVVDMMREAITRDNLAMRALLERVQAFGIELESSGVDDRANVGRELAGLLAGGEWHLSKPEASS